MTKAVTIRLDDADHAPLKAQAERIGVRPGTLARVLVRAGLTGDTPRARGVEARAALDRLARRSRQGKTGNAVALVAEARAALDPER